MTKEELADWKQHPVTKHFTEYFVDIRNDMIEALSRGHTIGEHTERETALMVGEIAGLNYFINSRQY